MVKLGSTILYYVVPSSCSSCFIGLYCIVFVLYIRVHTSKKCTNRNLLIYPISSLFVLCTAFFMLDFTQQYFVMVSKISLPPYARPSIELMNLSRHVDKEVKLFLYGISTLPPVQFTLLLISLLKGFSYVVNPQKKEELEFLLIHPYSDIPLLACVES